MARVLLTILLVLAAAAPAGAATRNEIIRDCDLDSQIQGDYTREEIRDALENLPTDIAIYGDCVDLLKRYEFGDSTLDPGPPPDGTGSGGTNEPLPTPTPPNVPETDADRQAIAAAPEVAQQPVTIGDDQVVAGVSPFRDGRPGNTLPAALVIALMLLAIAAVAIAGQRYLRRPDS